MKELYIDGFTIELEKKRIKNMYLRVLSADGRVIVTAPVRMTEADIKRFVMSKADWIEKQQEKLSRRNIDKELEYVSGEEIPLWGDSYELIIENTPNRSSAALFNGRILLKVKDNSTKSQREAVLNNLYHKALEQSIPEYIAKWERIIGVKSSSWNIRNMKTRWGTCNVREKKICLNLQLAKKPPECLEYVVVHELVHLLERSHNKVFKAYMDQFLPDWRNIRKRLNGME
ncbi:MAG TPA: SprT family zinc-dependent metalloprotease [Mobilitalea sp.]|nr:SprT family zinc-dependent metalloprotease [Mobilitalea sp.]